MMKRTTLAILAVAGILTNTAANAEQSTSTTVPQTMQCASITQDEVKGLFDQWNAALATGNADTVTARYSDDAVLLPTVSNKPRVNHAEIKDYFEHFLQKHPQGTINNRTIKLGCNTANPRFARNCTSGLKDQLSFDHGPPCGCSTSGTGFPAV